MWSGRTDARLFTFVGAAAGDGLGCGRSGGDSDSDGVADIAIGAFYTSAAGTPQGGAIFVYSEADGALLRTITVTTPDLRDQRRPRRRRRDERRRGDGR